MSTTRKTRTRAAAADNTSGELKGTLDSIRKRFGDAVVGQGSAILQPERIPTGAFMLDFATLGGIPHNRITKIVGQKHAGKTYLSDKIIAQVQRTQPDQRAVKLDIEGTHDATWSGKLGVDNDELYVAQPETGEAALDMCDAFIHTKEVSLIVVDSLAQLVPTVEVEGSMEDQFVGVQARMIGRFVRKAVSSLMKERLRGHEVTLLFINQFRSKIGGYSPHGEPLTEPGGKGLGFAYSLEITMKNKEEKGKDKYGVDTMVRNEHAFTITKNKQNGGPRTGEFQVLRVDDDDIGLGIGDIDDAETMLAYAKKFGAYTGGGSSWTLDFWDEEWKYSKIAEARNHLYSEPDLYWKLRNYLICTQAEHLGMPDYFIERFYP